MNYINYLFNFLLLFLPIKAKYIPQSGWYHLHMESDSQDILTINGLKYREGIFYKTLDLPIYFRFSGQYNISSLYKSYYNLNLIYKDGKHVNSNCMLSKNEVIKPLQNKNLCNIKYYYPKEHNLEIFGNFNFQELYFKKSKNINTLNIYGSNNIILNQDINHFNFYKKIRLSAGYHIFNLNYKNLDANYYCNCPSIYNGFRLTKYFSGIISDIEKKGIIGNNQLINESIKDTIYLQSNDNKTYKKNIYDVSVIINNTKPILTINKMFYNFVYSSFY